MGFQLRSRSSEQLEDGAIGHNGRKGAWRHADVQCYGGRTSCWDCNMRKEWAGEFKFREEWHVDVVGRLILVVVCVLR